MRRGLYANIHAKRKRGGKMRKKGAKGAPTAAQFRRAAMTVRKKEDDDIKKLFIKRVNKKSNC